MQPRMKHPAYVMPDVMQSLQSLGALLKNDSVPVATLYLVHLRASQINGCAFCVDMHARELKETGASDERLWAVAAWHDSPLFTEAERAALALTEAATRLADKPDAVPDEIWKEATRHYDERAMSTLLMNIAMINFWNRLNVPIKQPPAHHR